MDIDGLIDFSNCNCILRILCRKIGIRTLTLANSVERERFHHRHNKDSDGLQCSSLRAVADREGLTALLKVVDGLEVRYLLYRYC
jgi:hypothetical protein